MAIFNPANQAQKGHVASVVYLKSEQIPFNFPVPSGSTVNLSAQQQELTESNCRAVIQNVFRSTSQQDYTLELQYGYKLPDLIATALGRRIENATNVDSLWGMGAITVPDVASPSYAAVSSGTWGFGIVEDAPGDASYLNEDGVSIKLTQQAFAAFVPTTPLSFAIGANGALKFSEDLRGRRFSVDQVAIQIAEMYRLGGALGELAISLYLINNDFKLVRWDFPSATINPQSINNSDAAQSLQFFVSGEPNYEVLRQLWPCRDAR